MMLSAQALLEDASVRDGLRAAFLASDVGGAHPVEQGGFILFDETSQGLEIARLSPGEQDEMHYPVCPDGLYRGKRIVGSFHTHPNTGPEWTQEPSDQDIRLSIDYPETMGPHQFVVSQRLLYHVDSEGTVTIMGPTADLLRLGTTP